jgi:hypothetical protein
MPSRSELPPLPVVDQSNGQCVSACFRQAGASTNFTTNVPAAFADATATLYAYQTQPTAAADWHVTTLLCRDLQVKAFADALADAQVREVGPHAIARVLPSDDRTLFQIDDGTVIEHDHEARSVTAYCRDAEAVVHWSTKLVRQVMTGQLLASGAVYAHAAALTYQGHGILVAGHRRRGKTTTLLALLRHVGGDYVTNDRLLLSVEGGRVTGYPWPAHMRIGVGTLLAFPELADLTPHHLRTLPPRQRWDNREKISIEPPDYGRLMRDGAVAATCHPALMIWPSLSPECRTVRTDRIDADEVLLTLTRTRLFMIDPDGGFSSHINHWLIGTPATEQERADLHAVAAALAAKVPCYRLHAGDDPVAAADAVADLLPTAAVTQEA